jgi:hypothetical protein
MDMYVPAQTTLNHIEGIADLALIGHPLLAILIHM